jgi:hypothetical protein
VFTNAGSLRLGPGSTFTASTGYAQSPGGVLRTTINGLNVGKVVTTGQAALAGRLDVNSVVRPPNTDLTVVSYGARNGTFSQVTGAAQYTLRYDNDGVKLHSGAPLGALADAPATDGLRFAPHVATVRIDDSGLVVRGPWAQRGSYAVATTRGATLLARGVTGTGLALVARTCPTCGSVRVSWGRGLVRELSLKSRRSGRRTLKVVSLRRARTGTVRLRTSSSRRVAIDALVVLR